MKAVLVHEYEYEKDPSIADTAENDVRPTTGPAGHDHVLGHGGQCSASTPPFVAGHSVQYPLDQALAILVP